MSNEKNGEHGSRERSHNYVLAGQIVKPRPIDPALYLISTPIGNLADITMRALETLAAADILACEDTRVTRTLLTRYGIQRRPVAYHEHNAETAGAYLLEALDQGRSVALVSDAGTPLVSDPGHRLVELALGNDHRVIPIPGASAPLTALVASGLPNDTFFFAGFLPQKQKARRDRILAYADIPGTVMYFDSPHRIAESLGAACQVLGPERKAVVGRELTKAYEEFSRGTLAELEKDYASRSSIKGEIVLLIAPREQTAEKLPVEEVDELLRQLLEHHSTAKAASEAAKQTGLPRKELYQRLLQLKDIPG